MTASAERLAPVTVDAGDAASSVLPLLAFSSRTVELEMRFGDTGSKEVRLFGTLASSAHLQLVSVDPPGPTVVVLPAERDESQGVRVTQTGSRVGHQAGQVVLATGLDDPRELTLLYSSEVSGNLTVDPTRPFVDLRAPDPGVVIRVRSLRRNFHLDRAEVVEGPFVANVERDDAGDGACSVRVIPATSERGRSPQRGFLGKIRLVSNDPAEPTKEVPLFALGPLKSGVE